MILTNRGLTAATSVTMDAIQLERSKELLEKDLGMWDLLRWGKGFLDQQTQVKISDLLYSLSQERRRILLEH